MKRILIIDDNISFVGALKELLTITGHEVITAHNGNEALQLLSTLKELPALIILDMIMPVMNGLEFRTAQLQDPKLSHIPIILLTANNSFKDSKEKLQAYEFLNKPVDTKDLLYVVENFFFLNKRSITYASRI
jgi:CheY-like chemotaxis protein